MIFLSVPAKEVRYDEAMRDLSKNSYHKSFFLRNISLVTTTTIITHKNNLKARIVKKRKYRKIINNK